MFVQITRGLGGPKGRFLLVVTVVLGVVLVAGGTWYRRRLLAPKGVVAIAVPPAQVLALADKARGPSVQVAFLAGDLARIVAYAPARDAGNHWDGLAENTILKVTDTTVAEGETWVTGVANHGQTVTVHGSFLERYRPVVLDKLVELSDVRLLVVKSGPGAGTAVSGWLRNISPRTISHCLVTCVFQDAAERNVDARRAVPVDLPVGELVRFETPRTERSFASIAVQIMYATPDGLRDSLSTVVIQKSSLQ